jgi:hypothetical protein
VLCPANDELLAMLGTPPGGAGFAALELHIDACASCRKAVAALAAGSRTATVQPFAGIEPVLAAGAIVDGRYEVARELGRGGMGAVYLARDRKLDRDVALKLHRAGVGDGRGEPGLAIDRLAREAMAMAKLAHPNVVAVFEVASVDDRMYVAMEYVRGTTLRGWLAAARRWRDVVAMLIASGRGLAAAHAAGLVHRDFKPENVLVGDDGRPRVGDFGLARADRTRAAVDLSQLATADTDTRGISGTPAYMAPEQLCGDPVDARCDQFAFAVVAWECLYGERPFRGATLAALLEAIQRQDLRATSRGVPDAVRAVLARGLATAPADRFTDMPALLAALERAAEPRTARHVAVAAIAVATLGGAAGYGAHLYGAQRRAAACELAAGDMRGRFGPLDHARIAGALAATGSPLAASAIEHTVDVLDRVAHALADEAGTACGDDAPPTPARDARAACLAVRASELSGVVDRLAHVAAADVAHAPEAAWGIYDPTPCAAAPAGAAAMSLDHATQLGQVHALDDLGAYRDAEAAATALLADARATHDRAAEIGAALALGAIQDAVDPQAATVSYQAAAATAEQQGRDLEAATALGALAEDSARVRHDYAEANRQLELARAKLARIGGNAAVEARVDIAEADILMEENRMADAERAARAAVAHAQAVYGVVHPLVGKAEGRLSTVLRGEGNPAEELRYARLAYDHLRAAYGDDHPKVAAGLGNLGAALMDSGDTDEARRRLVAANAIFLASYGDAHPARAATWGNLGQLEEKVGHWDAARDDFQHARAVLVALEGSASQDVAGADRDLADALQMTGRIDDAIATDREAVAIYEQMGSDGDGRVGPALVDLCEQLLAGHRAAEAVPLAQRALALVEHQADANPQDIADARYALGRVLWETGAHARGRELVAAADHTAVDPNRKRDVDAWLAGHAP